MGKIAEIMRECNRYFPKTYENIALTFTAATRKIAGVFGETYKVGQYILIQHSTLNDSVYRIATVGTNEITVAETLYGETETCQIFGLAPPRDFIDLVTEIDDFTPKDGISSESIDDYSVSFSGDGSWKTAFKKRLDTYRAMTSDLGALVYANNRLLYYNGKTY